MVSFRLRPLYLGERTPDTKRIEGLMDLRANVDALENGSVLQAVPKIKERFLGLPPAA